MKGTQTMNGKLMIAIVAVFGLALVGTIPVLAQDGEPATEPAAVCPYHDQGRMTDEDMDRLMDQDMNRWMDSAEHDRMHDSIGAHMMDRGEMAPGNMMSGAGNMMGAPG